MGHGGWGDEAWIDQKVEVEGLRKLYKCRWNSSRKNGYHRRVIQDTDLKLKGRVRNQSSFEQIVWSKLDYCLMRHHKGQIDWSLRDTLGSYRDPVATHEHNHKYSYIQSNKSEM